MKKKRGFTLVELMVVMSIISLLSSIVLVSINSTKAKARDAARVSDMKTIQNSIEIFKSGGQLPWGYGSINSALSGILVPTYLPSIPVDPNPSAFVQVTYYYCNRDGFGTGNYCHNDTDLNTYAIAFFTETNIGNCTAYNGNWQNSLCCLTSSGIFKAETWPGPQNSYTNLV